MKNFMSVLLVLTVRYGRHKSGRQTVFTPKGKHDLRNLPKKHGRKGWIGMGREKNGKPNIAPLQPPTLAAFRSWGSSAGAGRADLPVQRYDGQNIIDKWTS